MVPLAIGAEISWLCPNAESTPALYTRTVNMEFAVSIARGCAQAAAIQIALTNQSIVSLLTSFAPSPEVSA
jgi:hypothetical protein